MMRGRGSLICVVGLWALLPVLLVISASRVGGAGPIDVAKTVGPNACAECHKQETEAWKTSHHFKTYREMPRNTKADEIADRLGVRRIRSERLCASCHFTLLQKNNRDEPVAGISCESCHNAGQDWIKLHSSFSGKTILFESDAEEKERWRQADAKGMIRPRNLYLMAKNCLGCHVVAKEDLVNKGGHKAGSAFDLLTWSQGEVRHNTWYSKGRENVAANAARRRMLYVVGLGADLETALRAIGSAKSRWLYSFEMAKRADRARTLLEAAAKAAPQVPELAEIVKLSRSAGLMLNNESRLTAAADGISQHLIKITATYDGSTLAGLDSLLPGPDAYKGTPRQPPN